MTKRKFYQLVDIPDYRYIRKEDASNINYDDISTDCDAKTISLLEAIYNLSISIMGESESKNIDGGRICNLSSLICDLSELAIATNKVAQSAAYSSGLQDGTENPVIHKG